MPRWRTLLVYAVIGPPIGWFVYAAGLMLSDHRTWESLAHLGDDLRFMLVGAPLGYIVGLIPAILAGILVVALASPEVRRGAITVTAIGLVCGVLFAFTFGGSMSADLESLGYFVLKVLTCLVPSLICWAIARRWRVETIETEHEADRR